VAALMPKTTTPRPARDYGPIQLAGRLGLAPWQFEAALDQQLIPPPDVGGRRWSAALADFLADQVDRIVAVVGAEHPIGAHRAAGRLADRIGLDVERADVESWSSAGCWRCAATTRTGRCTTRRRWTSWTRPC
jgi:hypothetical protein